MSHFTKSLRPPRTLTNAEAQRLLDASGRYAETLRDHLVFALAFGLGLRVHEIQALNVGDIYTPEGKPRGRLRLRVFKGDGKPGASMPELHLPAGLGPKLAKFYAAKGRTGDSLGPDAPLLVSRKGGRMTDRHMRRLLKAWLAEAGLDTSLRFHELRHTALTSFHERNRDVTKAQLFARHSDVRTTMRYLHCSAQAMTEALQGQLC